MGNATRGLTIHAKNKNVKEEEMESFLNWTPRSIAFDG